MTNLDSMLKSRGITLLTKVHIVKAMEQQTGSKSGKSTCHPAHLTSMQSTS